MEQDQINAGYENVAGTLKTQMKHLPKVFACGYCFFSSSLNYLKVNGISRITINPNRIMTITISLALYLFEINPVIYLVIYIKFYIFNFLDIMAEILILTGSESCALLITRTLKKKKRHCQLYNQEYGSFIYCSDFYTN